MSRIYAQADVVISPTRLFVNRLSTGGSPHCNTYILARHVAASHLLLRDFTHKVVISGGNAGLRTCARTGASSHSSALGRNLHHAAIGHRLVLSPARGRLHTASSSTVSDSVSGAVATGQVEAGSPAQPESASDQPDQPKKTRSQPRLGNVEVIPGVGMGNGTPSN